MNFIFDFQLSTPLLVFPAISLLMLAYTNRFVVLAELTRDLYKSQKDEPKKEYIDQIKNLQKRMDIIKKMQICGAASFISASISVLLGILSQTKLSVITFVICILLLIGSLIYLLRELTISIDALKIQLDDLSNE